MKKDKRYRLYPKAVQDLESIYKYSVKTFGFRQADSYLEEITQAFQAITDDSQIARSAENIYSELKVFNINSHMIFLKQ